MNDQIVKNFVDHSVVSGSPTSMAAQELRDRIIDLIASVLGRDASYINDFEFQVETTPMSHIAYPMITVTFFCVFIPALAHFMKTRTSPPLKLLILVHNIFLCVASASLAFFLMLTLYAKHEAAPSEFGAFRIYCGLSHRDQRGALTFIYYVNYLLKYYELLDTIFLSLKHKPLKFLHCYHHPATLVLTWGQLVDSTGIQWLVILLNLFVHTVMYFYYAMATLRVRMPWKKIVTVMQIVQFVLDLAACYIGWVLHNMYGLCSGHNRGAVVGCFILTSYLYLFIDFYEETYPTKKAIKLTQEQSKKRFKKNV